MENKFDVVIVGAGTGGIMTASQLVKRRDTLKIAIIDPAEKHYYQPAWTLVGADTYSFKDTVRPMKGLIPKGVTWIQESVEGFDTVENKVKTSTQVIEYKYLVVSPGVKMQTSLVEGLSEAMDKGNVCSVYTDPEHAKQVIKNFKGGVALFTQPTTPIKCGGAPQKFMYLAEEMFKKNGVRDKTDILYALPGSVLFGVKEVFDTLIKVVDRKNIQLSLGYQLVAVDSKENIAWYKMAKHENYHNLNTNLKTIHKDGRVGIKYDMLHLAPPQTTPDFVRNSELVNDAGWISVDKHSMQHTRFKNIFGIGDATNLPTAKTGAAIRKQVPIVIENIISLMDNGKLTDLSYNGYSSCPLVTGYGKMVLAEFDYDNNFTPDPKLKQMLIFNSDKEHWRLWMLKKYILPYLYWNKMMKGKNV